MEIYPRAMGRTTSPYRHTPFDSPSFPSPFDSSSFDSFRLVRYWWTTLDARCIATRGDECREGMGWRTRGAL